MRRVFRDKRDSGWEWVADGCSCWRRKSRLSTRLGALRMLSREDRCGTPCHPPATRSRYDPRGLPNLGRGGVVVSRNRNLVLTAMVFAVAMGFIDQTIVAIAIPNIQRELSLSATGAQWVINGYLLALSALFDSWQTRRCSRSSAHGDRRRYRFCDHVRVLRPDAQGSRGGSVDRCLSGVAGRLRSDSFPRRDCALPPPSRNVSAAVRWRCSSESQVG